MNYLFVILISSFVIVNMAFGSEEYVAKNYSVGGNKMSYNIKTFNPPYKIKKDKTRLNQSSAINCSHLYYSKLAAGDIACAAKLSNKLDMTTAKYALYMERMGKEEFKKMFEDYFGGNAEVRAEIVLGRHTMLVLYDSGNEMYLGQMYVKTDSTYMVAEQEDKEVDQLGSLLNEIQDGKMKLK